MNNECPCDTCITQASCKARTADDPLESFRWSVESCKAFRDFILRSLNALGKGENDGE